MHNTSTRCGAVQCGLFSQVKNGTTCAPQTVMPPNSTMQSINETDVIEKHCGQFIDGGSTSYNLQQMQK